MTTRDEPITPTNASRSKYMTHVKNVNLNPGNKSTNGISTPTYKMRQSFAGGINEREFRVVDSKQVNLSFLLNKDPALIETDLIKVCKMRKYQVEILGQNQMEITINQKKANLEICKVGKMKY